ncbi:uncharacterized protein LOC111359769 [Spodoptera litura]|uniref:Uncharacterized protein LOC111359769 n=1 Tax=Spodoptera litura TaxID=69820 RepID=A0A9J7EM55_SPOLT|nr:uncharacterized protein LOC111359769 [Spodoptera litura]XP_022831171.1 uncharacterized protein LOC111359769 [Spodoptera litura]
MDDIVDYFEEFIKKSLVVISLGLGTLILMIMYVFKMLADRPNGPRTLCNADPELNRSKASVLSEGKRSHTRCRSCNSINSEPKNVNSCISNPDKSSSLCSNPNKSSSVCSNPDKSSSVSSNPNKSCSVCSNTNKSSSVCSNTNKTSSACSNTNKTSSTCSNTNKTNSACSNPNKTNSACSNPKNCQTMNTSTSNTILTAKTASISAQITSHPRFDRKTLREVGLSGCSKICRSRSRITGDSDTECRSGPNTIEITKTPSEQMCTTKHHLANSRPCTRYIAIRTSCCSMCCVDDDRR